MLGEYLKEKRQQKGWSLKDLSEVTRIRTEYLAALEREDYSKIPGEVFIRGYIRAYLKALHIDPSEALQLYERENKKEGVIEEVTSVASKPSVYNNRLILTGAGVVFLLILSVLFFYTRQPRQTIKNVEVAQLPQAPQKESGKRLPIKINPVETAEADYKNKHVLEINTREETWIYLKIDDNLSYSMLLKPGEVKSWTAEKGFFLKIGNAGGIEISFDGQLLGSPGKRGQVVRLNLPEDIEKFARDFKEKNNTSE